MKYKKKEILAIAIILILALCLAFSSKIANIFDEEDEDIIEKEEESIRYVTITVTGEILEDNYQIKIKYGYSYGNIIEYIQKVSNDYSVINYNIDEKYYEDTTIVISSTDKGSKVYDEEETNICINTASKSELMNIYGIGEKRSDKIIEYRADKKIESFSELQDLLGVSDAIMEEIKKQAVL